MEVISLAVFFGCHEMGGKCRGHHHFLTEGSGQECRADDRKKTDKIPFSFELEFRWYMGEKRFGMFLKDVAIQKIEDDQERSDSREP